MSSGLTNLASLGIVSNPDGTLTVNQTAIDTATDYSPGFNDVLTSNLAAVQNFFTNANSTGFADNLKTALSSLTDPTFGMLSQDLASNTSQQNTLTTEISNFQTQLSAQTTQLDQVFDNLNATLEEYPFALDEVTEELASMTSGASTATPITNSNTAPTAGNGAPTTNSPSSS